jgi:hypothetical protein
VNTDTVDATKLLESEENSLFDVDILIDIIDDEWKGWRMCQHVGYRCARCTNEVKIQERC